MHSSKVKKKKNIFFLFCIHTTFIIIFLSFLSSLFIRLSHFLYSFIFLFFSFLKAFSPSSQNFHSNSFLFLLNFFSAVWGSLLLPCGGGCGCSGSSASWPCRGYGESLVSSHAVGVGLCRGVRGPCRGVCVVGHQCRGHAMGMVGHRFWVMPWVLFLWLWADFDGIVVVGCVKCWLTGGCNCFFFINVVVIKIDILFYCNGYIILMCCLCYFIMLKSKIKTLIFGSIKSYFIYFTDVNVLSNRKN